MAKILTTFWALVALLTAFAEAASNRRNIKESRDRKLQRFVQKGGKNELPENNVNPAPAPTTTALSPTKQPTVAPIVLPVTEQPTDAGEDFVEEGIGNGPSIVELPLIPFRLEVTSASEDLSQEDLIDAVLSYLQSRLFSGIASLQVVGISVQARSNVYTGMVNLQVPRTNLDWDLDTQQEYWLITQKSQLETALREATGDSGLTVDNVSLEDSSRVALSPFVLELSHPYVPTTGVTAVLTDFLQSNMYTDEVDDESNAPVVLSVNLRVNAENVGTNKLAYTGSVELVLPVENMENIDLSVAEEQEYWLVTRQSDLEAALQDSLSDFFDPDPVSIVSIEVNSKNNSSEAETEDPEVDKNAREPEGDNDDDDDDDGVTAATSNQVEESKSSWVYGSGAIIVVVVVVVVALSALVFTMYVRRKYVQRRKPSGRRRVRR